MKKIILLLLLLFAPFAYAADASPKAFLDGIYSHYTNEQDKMQGVPLSSEETIRKYFTPSLVDLIIHDDNEAAKRDEVPLLDGDPFVEAQEWDIPAFDIKINQTEAGKAEGSVVFTNYGETKTLQLSLLLMPEGWRIDDIKSNEGSLRGFYASSGQ